MKRCSGLLVFRAAHIKILTMFYFLRLRLANILVWQHQMLVRLWAGPIFHILYGHVYNHVGKHFGVGQ